MPGEAYRAVWLALLLFLAPLTVSAWISTPNSRSTTLLFSMSASQQERRDEDARRQARKEEVVIGKTSAQPEAKDFDLNVQETEQQYLKSLNQVQRRVFELTEGGLFALKQLKIDEAVEAFESVFELKPDAYLWQAGIAHFYARNLERAREIFAQSQDLYEDKFQIVATEERIWYLTTSIMLYHSKSKSFQDSTSMDQFVGPVIIPEHLDTDGRRILTLMRRLLEASYTDIQESILLLAELEALSMQESGHDRKLWKLQANFFLGLYFTLFDPRSAAQRYLKQAIILSPNPNADDLIHALPLLHMKVYDLFDDDEVHDESDFHFAESIRRSVGLLKHEQLKTLIRSTGTLQRTGSKRDLQIRIFKHLVAEYQRRQSLDYPS